MESNVDYYYDINRKLLSLAGQWPYQKPKEKRSFLILLLIFLSNVIFTQVAQFCICEDAQCIYQTLPPHMLAIMVLVKIFTFYFNRQKIKVLTDRLFIDWNMFENEDEREIMKKYAETGRWYSLIYAFNAHRKALQFEVLLENTFTVPFTIQILIVTVGMSITLVQFSIQLHNLAEATRYIVFIICQLIHLFCFSFQGQKLINHSLETCDKIFYSSWYEIPVNAQRLLLMVLRKSIIASTLTAGKIYVFSLESFTTVLQTSMSYFTVLSSFNE